MNIIFMGTPDFSVPVLNALHQAHEIVAVYCQPPRPAGRGKADRPTPVHARALELGLPVRHRVSLRSETAATEIVELGADVAVVVAYGLILPQEILDAPRLGCLNIHASLLPRWRGAAPIQRAVLAEEQVSEAALRQWLQRVGLDSVIEAEYRTIEGLPWIVFRSLRQCRNQHQGDTGTQTAQTFDPACSSHTHLQSLHGISSVAARGHPIRSRSINSPAP